LADALINDYRTAPIDPGLKELLCFTEKSRDAGQITAADIAGLRGAGFSDRAFSILRMLRDFSAT
jgi:hypothetical protein